VRPVGTALREIIREMLAEAQRRGEVREDIDVDRAARIVNALLIAVGDSWLVPYLNTYYQLTDAETTLEDVLNSTLDLIERGIAPASGRNGT
jgi:hypothetical protein